MKILIATHNLTGHGGSESHARCLAEEFKRRGHDVMLSDANVHSLFPWMPDVAFLSHNTTVANFFEAFPQFDESKVVQTIHGLVPRLEKPFMGKDINYVAISEEIAEAYKDLNCSVILNGVNLDKFKPIRELNEKPQTLLSMAQSEPFNDMLRGICNE
ncbi:MAG: hypothetical protein C0600_12855, partial [Ignavibacteria bacterium]